MQCGRQLFLSSLNRSRHCPRKTRLRWSASIETKLHWRKVVNIIVITTTILVLLMLVFYNDSLYIIICLLLPVFLLSSITTHTWHMYVCIYGKGISQDLNSLSGGLEITRKNNALVKVSIKTLFTMTSLVTTKSFPSFKARPVLTL